MKSDLRPTKISREYAKLIQPLYPDIDFITDSIDLDLIESNNMTNKEFKKLALRTESNVTQAFKPLNDNRVIRLLHCALGLATEAGEFNDVLKKHIFYGKELDIVNLKEEAGDLLWYLCLLCDECNVDFEDLMTTTIDKLKARYPNKFSKKDALNRDLVKERDVLDKGFNK